MLPTVDTHEPREGVTNPKRTCANREGEPQITQTPVESYTGVAMVDVDFDTLNRGDQVRGFNKKRNRSSSICKSTTVKTRAPQCSTLKNIW